MSDSSINNPRWLSEAGIQAVHAELIAEHGGTPGLRDPGLLSASLARPQHLFFYNKDASLFDLAAAYGYGLVKNHCFIDGNKRIALAAIALFLRKNGYQLVAPEAEAVEAILRLAEGAMDQEQLAAWITANSQQL